MTATPILYDPDCGFCRVCVALLLRWDRDGRLRPVPLGGPEANELLGEMPDAERMASWHLVRADGSVRSAGRAFPDLFGMLPAGAPLARLTGLFPRASERGYRWVADQRTTLGRPIPDAARRWADRVISESRADNR
jgi:predicted DCC family thiol-disulfide oxidoreductase YuxK